MSFPLIIIILIFRFISTWLISAFLLTFVWYGSEKEFALRFQQNWWFESIYRFSEFLMINLVLFFFLCVIYFILIKGLLRNYSGKSQIIFSALFPIFSILIFEIITHVNFFFLTKNFFFQLFGIVVLLISGLIILVMDNLICKWIKMLKQ